jgi:hypothetical protein
MTIKADAENNLKSCNHANEGHPIINGNLASGNIEASTVKKIWWPRLPFVALLIIFTVWAYLPSLDKVFINDQMSYFLELNGETSLASGFHLLDYGANRQYNKGDEVLYRPLLFILLALENYFFHRDFRLWNVANLVFHLLVAYLLFEVLWRIKRTLLACGFALLFALLMSNFEMVTWNHLGGYILGYGLLLIALLSAREMVQDEGNSGIRWFWIYGIAMTGAMLFHEIAVIAGFGAIAYVGYCRRSKINTKWVKLIAATGTPILIYAGLYSFHVLQCNRFFDLAHGFGSSPIKYLAAISLLILHWLQHIFFPVPSQLVVLAMYRSSWTPFSGTMIPEIIIAGVLWAGTLFFLRQGFELKYLKKYLPFAALICFLIISYAGMNIVGRFDNAMEVPYYDYFPALFSMLLLYSLIDFSKVQRTSKIAALICLFLLTLNNGWNVRNISNKIQEIYSPMARSLKWIEQTVRPQLSNPDFSYYIKGIPKELDIKGRAFWGYPDQGNYVAIPLLYFLYGKYYNSLTPSHILVVRDIQTGKMDLLTIK